ncbi:hypothetical protein B296_00035753 [Ensete ventricosum]|uniref:Uncharacterized protein n=1 Tax=Ensete ventricosum TaxID=4639 RepID=A0A426ZWB4_ENSVE|nr:hypothetical protein B296_00035753 [Ensete ventricosum]
MIIHGLGPKPSQLSLDPIAEASATHDTDLPRQENEGACEQGGTSQRCLSGDRSQEGDSPRGPHGEGSNRWRDKAVSRPRSIRDLCRVKAHSQNEPFLTREITDLPEMYGEGPLEVRWAMLTPRSKVWAKVQKLKDKVDPVVVAANEVRANEATQRAKEYPQLEIEEDPYAILLKDDNMLMEVEWQ